MRFFITQPMLRWLVQGPEIYTPRLEEPVLKWQVQRPQTDEVEGAW